MFLFRWPGCRLAVVLWALGGSAVVWADTAQHYVIPAGELSASLNRLAREGGITLSFDPAAVQGKAAPALNDVLPVEEALAQLLAGSGLVWFRAGEKDYTVVAASPERSGLQLSPVRVAGSGATAAVEMAGAGTVSVVTRETLDRFPVTSTSDVVRGIPGVVAVNARNGASMDVNIRGVQGDRVKVLVDGTQSTTNTSKSYGGEGNHNYVDPDLIGSVSVEKGPTTGPYGAGTGGGVVRLNTLSAADLITDDRGWGLRLRGSWANNATDGNGFMDYTGATPLPYHTPSQNRAGSLAGAWVGLDDRLELVFAHSRRDQGNYRAGHRGSTSWTYDLGNNTSLEMPYTLYGPDAEVFNTSQETRSTLLKMRANLPQDHWLELSYNNLDTRFGESRVTSYAYNIEQKALGEADKTTWLLRHGWQPAGNPWWHLRTNLWRVDVDESHPEIVYSEAASTTRTQGAEFWNSSAFAVAGMNTNLSYGVALQREKNEGMGATEPRGERDLRSGFLQGDIWLTHWLNLEAGARHEAYTAQGTGSFVSPIPGQDRIPYEIDDGHERLNPTVGLNIVPLAGWTLYARYSEGWRPPTPKEVGLTYGYGRSVLKPEVTKSREIGIKLNTDAVLTDHDALSAQLSWFDNRHDDYMARMLGDSNSPYYYINIDGAHFRGVEFSLRYDTGWLFAEYGVNHFKQAEFCGLPAGCHEDFREGGFNVLYGLISPPKQMHHITLGVRLFEQRLTLGMRGTVASGPLGKSIDPNSGAQLNSGWTDYDVYDVFGDVRITDSLDVGFSVENLRDRYYVEAMTSPSTALPAPGRIAKAHFTYRF